MPSSATKGADSKIEQMPVWSLGQRVVVSEEVPFLYACQGTIVELFQRIDDGEIVFARVWFSDSHRSVMSVDWLEHLESSDEDLDRPKNTPYRLDGFLLP